MFSRRVLTSKKFVAAAALVSVFTLFLAVYYQQQRTSVRSKAAAPSRQSLEGQYLVEHKHYGELETGRSTTDAFLKKDDGSQVKLRFSKAVPAGITPGSRVRVTGSSLGPKDFSIAPADLPSSLPNVQRDIILEKLGGNEIQIIQPRSKVLGASTVVKLAVVLINFQNYTAQPYDINQIIKEAKTNVDSLEKYIEENSYNKIDLQVDVLGYYTVDKDLTTGGFSGICEPTYEDVKTKASQAGVNLDSYHQIILTSPTNDHCSFNGGVSDMHRVARILFKDKFTQANRWRNYAMHELTHNFGAHHSGNLSCTNGGKRVTISGSCTSDSANRLDPFGIQGMSDNHLNVYNKLQTNFLSQSQVPTITGSGTHTIQPFATNSSGIKGLKVAGSSRSYWLEFRQPYGLFDDFDPASPVVNGISIRTIGGSGFLAGLVILDNTPQTDPAKPNDKSSFMDGSIRIGSPFYDSAQKIAIETLSVSPAGAQVKVTFNASPPPAGATPTIAVATPTPTPASATPTPTKKPSTTPTQKPTATPTKKPTTPPAKAPTSTIPPTGSDRTAPSTPTQLMGYGIQKGAYLVWRVSTDNRGVTGYHITRNNVRIKTINWPSNYPTVYLLDSGLVTGRAYSYKVQAFDAAGNVSSYSNAISVVSR